MVTKGEIFSWWGFTLGTCIYTCVYISTPPSPQDHSELRNADFLSRRKVLSALWIGGLQNSSTSSLFSPVYCFLLLFSFPHTQVVKNIAFWMHGMSCRNAYKTRSWFCNSSDIWFTQCSLTPQSWADYGVTCLWKSRFYISVRQFGFLLGLFTKPPETGRKGIRAGTAPGLQNRLPL